MNSFLSALSTVRHPFVAIVWLFFGLSASAWQADVLRRVRLSHWGITPHHFSGIAPLGEQRYAVVSDKDTAAGFHVWHIEQDSLTGAVVRVVDEGFRSHSPLPAGRPTPDYEGVAFDPYTRRLWIADESTQQIRAYALNGRPTGDSLRIPADWSKAAVRPNRGFEALTFSTFHSLLWTTPEEPPRAARSSVSAGTQESDTVGAVVDLLGFSRGGALARRVPYRIDRSATAGALRTHLNGIPALCALPDGSLIVMERELIVPRRYLGSRCEVRLSWDVERVNCARAQTITRALDHALAFVSFRSGQLRRPLSRSALGRRTPNAAVHQRRTGWGRALVSAHARCFARRGAARSTVRREKSATRLVRK